MTSHGVSGSGDTPTGRPRLLDLGCCAGGATKGYQRAGFHATGVDLAPQPNYCGDKFYQADMLDFLFQHWSVFDAIHVSPPCQLHSRMTNCRPGVARTYPDLIGPVRELLEPLDVPWVIENVVGAPLRADVMLCGQMFGLPLYRHRLFESNVPLTQPEHPPHLIPASKAGHWRPGTIISVSGHVSPIKLAREAMGIDWTNRHELAESIPPAYAEHVGRQLMAHVLERAA